MGSVGGTSTKITFNVNRDRYSTWVTDSQKERAESAIKDVSDVIQQLVKDIDRWRTYSNSDDVVDAIYNGLADAFPRTDPGDESKFIIDTRDGDLIGVDVSLLGLSNKMEVRTDLKPIIWSQDEFTDKELYEYFGIEKRG